MRGRMGGMKYRKLRIAWSVGCGIICLLLIVLWVRSFNWFDDLAFLFDNSQSMVAVQSAPGSLCVTWQDAGLDTFSEEYYSRIFNAQRRDAPPELTLQSIAGRFHVFKFRTIRNNALSMPFWFLVITSATLAAFPWIRWSKRFSLRTLLIATALVAMALGLIAVMVRWPAA
jgi:hypothetical protein